MPFSLYMAIKQPTEACQGLWVCETHFHDIQYYVYDVAAALYGVLLDA
jgi:hypothetical protein